MPAAACLGQDPYRTHPSTLALVREGLGSVELPLALERKYPRAAFEWGWQWVFPATRHYTDPVSGRRRRHHLHESVLQKAVREAALRARIVRPARRCLKADATWALLVRARPG